MRNSIKLCALIALVLVSLSGSAFAASYSVIGYDDHHEAWSIDTATAHRYRADHQYAVDITIGAQFYHVAIDYFHHTYSLRYADGSWGGWRDIDGSMMMGRVQHWLDNQDWQINS